MNSWALAFPLEYPDLFMDMAGDFHRLAEHREVHGQRIPFIVVLRLIVRRYHQVAGWDAKDVQAASAFRDNVHLFDLIEPQALNMLFVGASTPPTTSSRASFVTTRPYPR